jgi:hypothetical protein
MSLKDVNILFSFENFSWKFFIILLLLLFLFMPFPIHYTQYRFCDPVSCPPEEVSTYFMGGLTLISYVDDSRYTPIHLPSRFHHFFFNHSILPYNYYLLGYILTILGISLLSSITRIRYTKQ